MMSQQGIGGMMGGGGGGFQPMGLMQMLTGTGAFKPKEEAAAPAKGPQNAFDVSGMGDEDLDMLRAKLGV
jgi:hypothetical protein